MPSPAALAASRSPARRQHRQRLHTLWAPFRVFPRHQPTVSTARSGGRGKCRVRPGGKHQRRVKGLASRGPACSPASPAKAGRDAPFGQEGPVPPAASSASSRPAGQFGQHRLLVPATWPGPWPVRMLIQQQLLLLRQVSRSVGKDMEVPGPRCGSGWEATHSSMEPCVLVSLQPRLLSHLVCVYLPPRAQDSAASTTGGGMSLAPVPQPGRAGQGGTLGEDGRLQV